ncbi:uncharacterized protein JN550_013559 [Neoarthrinium moseri]|uniref:uncharacterized protein n=1 Tax=Neoarthrinium moseri TaxID=1658444 RepID=UPI001FDAE824|nr:uncharacterized protein JN550_013559 [Neoarthrinium moseri]KAI1856957.1 hypothetical protein JN550_013559 [Neoarthrinium moseri]
MGLKLGLNGDASTFASDGYPSSEGYEEKDAQLLAAWGIGYWNVWTWVASVGNSWRMGVANWGTWADVVSIASTAGPIALYASRGAFNDFDMMAYFFFPLMQGKSYYLDLNTFTDHW